MNNLQDVDLFDIMKVKAFEDCDYGWEIRVPLHASGKGKEEEEIVPGIRIFDVIKNGCRVHLSSEDFENDWACITFIQENKNSGFAYESVFYKLHKTLTVESVAWGEDVIEGTSEVKNVYGLRYYFLPREQLISSLWRKNLDFKNKQQKNVNASGCENYIEPSNLEKMLIMQTECICFEIKKNPNEKCNTKEKYYLAAVDHAKKSYIKTGVGLSFKQVESEKRIKPNEYCGVVADCNLYRDQLWEMYKRNKPELIVRNIDDKKEVSKNPFIKIDNPYPGDCATIKFNLNCTAIFNDLKNFRPATSIPKKLRELLQKQKNNKSQKFYLRYEICCKSGDSINEYNEAFSYQNKKDLKNSVGEVCSFSVCEDKVDDGREEEELSVWFDEIYEMKLYVGTKRGVDFFIPGECMCFTCVDVSEEKISFGLVNSNKEIEIVFHDFVKDIEIDNLAVCKKNGRSFEQFKSLPTQTKEEIDKQYKNFIDKRNLNHEFGENKSEMNMSVTTNTSQNISSPSSGFFSGVSEWFSSLLSRGSCGTKAQPNLETRNSQIK